MAKKPRPSINDQLAALASARPPELELPVSRVIQSPVASDPQDDITTLPRNNVETGKVKRGYVNMVESERSNVVTSPRDDAPDGYKRRVRFEKPHASVYAHPKVFKALREIAAAQDCKPHDLYLEGLRLVLRAYGRDFDALNRGE